VPKGGSVPENVGVQPRNARYATLRDSDLILAMRRDEPHAFVEFIERLRIVAWNQARDLGIAAGVRKSWTEDVLHDCALALLRDHSRIPANLAGYVVVSVRRKFFAEIRRERSDEKMAEILGEELTWLWDARDDTAAGQLPEPVARLVDRIVEMLSDEEELLLVWKGYRITYGTIAEWLGESRAAVAQRIWRLTRRVSEASEQILAQFTEAEREIVRYFLHGPEEKKDGKS